jgi:enoyl-CoA hydratase/carnithine racemase
MTGHVIVERRGAVLSATLNRPEKKNALTGAMYETLTEALATASADADLAVVLFSGAGGVFTAGNDILDFATRAQDPSAVEDSPGGQFIRALARFDKPLIAAVEGNAVGVGTTLCFHCDLVYAAPSARFRMPFVDLGLVPEAGASMLAPLRFGQAKAAQYLLLGEAFDAETARQIGFVNAVAPAEDLFALAMQAAQALAQKPRAAMLATRRLMRGDREPLYAHMEQELEAFAAAVRSPEARKAFITFLGKGK